jgi:hypothetical protein
MGVFCKFKDGEECTAAGTIYRKGRFKWELYILVGTWKPIEIISREHFGVNSSWC